MSNLFVEDPNGKKIHVEMTLEMKGWDIKTQLVERLNSKPIEQRLWLDGRWENELRDEDSVVDTHLEDGDLLYVTLRRMFQVGMKLEARDRKHPTFLCPATVKAVDQKNRRILITFDGWSDHYDYWTEDSSLDLAPLGTVEDMGFLRESVPGRPEWIGEPAAPRDCFVEHDVPWFSNGPHKERIPTGSLQSSSEIEVVYPDPPHLDRDPSDTRPFFQKGQLLEARDQQHRCCIYPAEVEKIKGVNILVRLLGRSPSYKYWTRDDAMDIAPIGTCNTLGYVLERPEKASSGNAAPPSCFASPPRGVDYFCNGPHTPLPARLRPPPFQPRATGDTRPLFQVGQMLEARDRRNPATIQSAIVSATRGAQILIQLKPLHYDYWTDDSSLDIAPEGTCERLGYDKVPLTRTGGEQTPAPLACFISPSPGTDFFSNGPHTPVPPERVPLPYKPRAEGDNRPFFQKGATLEACDRKNPSLLCPAVVDAVKGGNILIHFLGWTRRYDYWTSDDTLDIAPEGTCAQLGRRLEPPGFRSDDIQTLAPAPPECFVALREGDGYFPLYPRDSSIFEDDTEECSD